MTLGSRSFLRFGLLLAALSLGSVAHALDVQPPQGLVVKKKEVVELGEQKFYIKCAPGCALRQKDAKQDHFDLVLSGRIERRDVFRKDGAGPIGPAIVLKEYREALLRSGAELMNPGVSPSLTQVFRARRTDGAFNWVVLHDNFEGYHTLYLIEEKTRASTVRVDDLQNAIAAEGWATLYIEFDTNRSELKADGLAAVEQIVALLTKDAKLRLSIEGHTDNVGEAAANRRLSLARAEAVRSAVLAKGIPAARLQARGHGPDFPIADNRKEAGRAKNRRVELLPLP